MRLLGGRVIEVFKPLFAGHTVRRVVVDADFRKQLVVYAQTDQGWLAATDLRPRSGDRFVQELHEVGMLDIYTEHIQRVVIDAPRDEVCRIYVQRLKADGLPDYRPDVRFWDVEQLDEVTLPYGLT